VTSYDFEEKWRNEMFEFPIEHAMKAKHGDEFLIKHVTMVKPEDETPHDKTDSKMIFVNIHTTHTFKRKHSYFDPFRYSQLPPIMCR
jgi:hypothetical protein